MITPIPGSVLEEENIEHEPLTCINGYFVEVTYIVGLKLSEIARHTQLTNKISREEEKEGCDGDAREENLDGLSVTLSIYIGKGQDVVVVDMSGEEDAVQDEREAKSNGKDGTIPKMELVRQIHVSKKCVGVKRLSSKSGDQNPNRKTTAGDEEVLRLALDKEDGEETDEARDAGKDSDGDAISFEYVGNAKENREFIQLSRWMRCQSKGQGESGRQTNAFATHRWRAWDSQQGRGSSTPLPAGKFPRLRR